MEKSNRSDEVSALLTLHGGKDVENIWVRPRRGKVFQVRTVPFWAYNLSLDDFVECEPDEDGEGLFIKSVVKKSGNRTVRVAFQGKKGVGHAEGVKLRDYYKKHKLKYEIFEPAMFAINVPSDEEYEMLVKRLDEVPESAQMIWEDGDPQPRRNLDGSYVKGAKRRPRSS
jgi:hypothetical protein